MRATGFKNLKKPLSAEKKAAVRAENEALALYAQQLERMCWRKVGYVDSARAERAVVKGLARNPSTPLRAYKCPACVFWHLTSTGLA